MFSALRETNVDTERTPCNVTDENKITNYLKIINSSILKLNIYVKMY